MFGHLLKCWKDTGKAGYRFYLKIRYGVGKPLGFPQAPWMNAVLKTNLEWQEAVEKAKMIGLPLHPTLSKNWDSLAALNYILDHTERTSNILDAGTELYSTIMPWLFLYGYEHLTGINLAFNREFRRGPIRYVCGDITQTRLKENTFDAIFCQSVIEHGVIIHDYLKEMSRILKPNGLLITSTDYSTELIDTHDIVEYGLPWRIFSKNEIIKIFDSAKEFNLELTGSIDLDCRENTITWKGMHYTFIVFAMQKLSSS